jgi:hypothetical protein
MLVRRGAARALPSLRAAASSPWSLFPPTARRSSSSSSSSSSSAAAQPLLPPHFLLRLPPLSHAMLSGRVAVWHVRPGDALRAGDALCDVATRSLLARDGGDDAVGAEVTLTLDVHEDALLVRVLVPAGTQVRSSERRAACVRRPAVPACVTVALRACCLRRGLALPAVGVLTRRVRLACVLRRRSCAWARRWRCCARRLLTWRRWPPCKTIRQRRARKRGARYPALLCSQH